MSKKYRRPDALPKLRKKPSSGDLVFYQDLDGEIFPVLVLEDTIIKGSRTKAVKVLSGNRITNYYVSDLKGWPQ